MHNATLKMFIVFLTITTEFVLLVNKTSFLTQNHAASKIFHLARCLVMIDLLVLNAKVNLFY